MTEIVDRYLAGESASAIARSLGTATSSVARVLARLGVRAIAPATTERPDVEAEVARRYEAGEPTSVLAREFGHSGTWVRAVAHRHGVRSFNRGQRERRFSGEEVGEIVRLWDEGQSQAAIARELATSQMTVSRVLRDQGVEPAPRRPRGESHGSWKGGRVLNNGYVRVRVDPDDPIAVAMADSTGYVPEHRLVMAHALGRPLLPGEQVHHKKAKSDNRLESLQLRIGNHGQGAAFVCRACGSHDIVAVPIG